MKILSMTATFGPLERATLEVKEGLNLIHAPNEGGKSSWCAFLMAMLYGIDTRDRDKKGALADKNHYQPWSGAPMEGELNLEWQGRAITLRRGPRGTVPFGSFSAVYTATGEPVPGMTAQTCGELLTGVSRPVFERSAFLGGDALPVTADPQLEKRIAAILSSGEEDVSFSQAQAKLKEWANRRRVNRSVGLIPKLEEERDQVARSLAELEGAAAQAARLEGEYARLVRDRDRCAAQVEAHRASHRQDLNERYTQAHEDLVRAKAQLAHLEQDRSRFGTLPDPERLRQAQGELAYLKVLDEEIQNAQKSLKEAEAQYVAVQRSIQEHPFAGVELEDQTARIQKDLRDYRSCMDSARLKQSSGRLFSLLGLILGAGYAGFLYFTQGMLDGQGLFVSGLLLIICLLIGFLNHTNAKSWTEKAGKLLARWQVESPEELEARLRHYRELWVGAEEEAADLKRIRGALNDHMARRSNDTADLMALVHSFAPEVTTLFGCSAALSKALSLDHDLSAAREKVELCGRRKADLAAQGGTSLLVAPQPAPDTQAEEALASLNAAQAALDRGKAGLDTARGTLAALGDPAQLHARLEELDRELDRRSRELDALQVAQTVLKEASSLLQERFSPQLNALAGEYLKKLTGGRYTSLTLNRDMEGGAARAGDVLPHSALYLSRGTADQLYLAVRLAVCRLCLPDRPPLVLDDALVTFDDERMKLALDLLAQLGREQQLLLFTCQSREAKALGIAPLELG